MMCVDKAVQSKKTAAYVFAATTVQKAKQISQELAQIEFELNNRPRECLGFKTPAEVLFKLNPRTSA
jgi:IS30 family transposase